MWNVDANEANVLYGIAFFACVVAFIMQIRADGWRTAIVTWPLWIIVAIAVDQYVWWRT